MRKRFTWVVVGCLGAVAVAATLDAARSGDSTSTPRATTAARTTTSQPASTGNVGIAPSPPTATATVASPVSRCAKDQLALTIRNLDGVPAAVFHHVNDGPCRQGAADVRVRILTPDGKGQGLLLGPEGTFEGLYAPGAQTWVGGPPTTVVVAFRYSPKCGERGPFLAVVRAGPYSARKEIPVLRCGMTIDGG